MGVVEVTRFRLAEGVDDDTFLALDRRLQTELIPNRPGFLRRTTARRDGDWVVVTLWWSEEDAATFERATESDPLVVEFDRQVAPGTLERARFDTLD
jgi:heme-degrading monooxygenase HmoA